MNLDVVGIYVQAKGGSPRGFLMLSMPSRGFFDILQLEGCRIEVVE